MLTRRDLREILSGPFYLDGFFSGIATSGDVNTLVDISPDGIQDAAYDTDRFDNAYVYIPIQDGRTIEESQRVLAYEPGSGSITIGRNWGQEPSVGTYYEIHTHGVGALDVNKAIDWSCKNARQEAWFMLGGMVSDGEMQYVDMSYWNINLGVGAYKYVYSTQAGVRRVARIQANDVDEHIYQTLTVSPGNQMKIYALVRAGNEMNASIQIHDDQHNTNIEVSWTGDTPVESSVYPNLYLSSYEIEEFWGGTFTVPDGCYTIQLRLGGCGDWTSVALYDNKAQETLWPGFLNPVDQYALSVAYYVNYGSAAQTATVVPLNAPIKPEGPIWRMTPAQYPGPLAVRAAVPIPEPFYDTDMYPPMLENYLVAGAYRFISTQLARPETLDNTRFEMLRVKAERDWQGHSLSRNPLARSRMVWSRR
jgi:hypothetical protein